MSDIDDYLINVICPITQYRRNAAGALPKNKLLVRDIEICNLRQEKERLCVDVGVVNAHIDELYKYIEELEIENIALDSALDVVEDECVRLISKNKVMDDAYDYICDALRIEVMTVAAYREKCRELY